MAGIGTFNIVGEKTIIILKESSIQAVAIEAISGNISILGSLGLTYSDGTSNFYMDSNTIELQATGNKYIKFASSTGAIEYLKITVPAGASCNIITENFV